MKVLEGSWRKEHLHALFYPLPLWSATRRDTLLPLATRVRRWYDPTKEAAMIELTEQQLQALQNSEATPPRIVNPRTKETFVLLRVDEYERLKEQEYDDSPWTREELQALAWEAGEHTGWEEVDDAPEKS
jgi:hypothetical protein